MKMQRPYIYTKCGREMVVSSGDVLCKDVKFQTLFDMHYLCTC